MARRWSLRSQLYRAAQDLGNIEAAEKGPTRLRQAGRGSEGVPQDKRTHPEVPQGVRAVVPPGHARMVDTWSDSSGCWADVYDDDHE
jgi:hypothetical protein